ncbi:hypothetical protein KC909_03445 [Candidatus Dojkabacteria bacterium]|uniref:Uncharacterized protein n=1 Tax=Candidatus Dojkabacteria bacterium TaxID=2099670 RepID=A0A955L679_9BACT|nr:hypothetical protein [Candidatus Dojkabacteria bacterium]
MFKAHSDVRLFINSDMLEREQTANNENRQLSHEEKSLFLTDAGIELSAEQAEHVQVISTPRTNIVFVENEYLEPGSPSYIAPEYFIDTGRVSSAVVEYFFPEFALNVDRSVPIVRQYAQKRMASLENAPRFTHTDHIASLCADRGVDIAVAEIADAPEYILSDLTVPALTTMGLLELVTLEAVFKEVGVDPGQTIDLIRNLFVASFITPYIQLLAGTLVEKIMKDSGRSISEFSGFGMYNRKKQTWSEKLVFSMEKARRKNVADGILFLDQQYPIPETDQEKPWITVFYPPAHAMRIREHIINPGIMSDRGQAIYKVLAPYLNWELSIWRHKNMLNLGNEGSGHWNLISEHNLRS